MLVGAMDIGGTKTLVGIIDHTGKILCSQRFMTCKVNFKEFAIICRDILIELLKNNDMNISDLHAIGVSIPGMVDFKQKVIIKAPVMGWNNIYAKAIFSELFDIPVFIDNDANNCGRGEGRFSGAKGSYMWVTVSTGIGSALFSDSKIVFGSGYCAGELGHIKVERKKPERCPCGQYGCLEAHASGSAITRMFRHVIKDEPQIKKIFEESGYSPDAKGCAMLAKEGIQQCRDIYECAGDYLGIALASAASMINPDKIYFGGGISNDLDLLITAVEKRLSVDLIVQNQDIKLMKTGLGYNASLLGAAALALES